MENFIQEGQFLIKERFAIIRNTFDIYNTQGEVIAQAREELGLSKFLLGLFKFCFCDVNGTPYAYIEKEFTWFTPTITVYDGNHQPCGRIEKKIISLKPCLRMYDASGMEFARLHGNFIGWHFDITANDGHSLGTISKKFNGIVNELFTTKDKYMVTLSPDLMAQDQRIVSACATCVIDMLLHEADS